MATTVHAASVLRAELPFLFSKSLVPAVRCVDSPFYRDATGEVPLVDPSEEDDQSVIEPVAPKAGNQPAHRDDRSTRLRLPPKGREPGDSSGWCAPVVRVTETENRPRGEHPFAPQDAPVSPVVGDRTPPVSPVPKKRRGEPVERGQRRRDRQQDGVRVTN